MLYTPQAIKLNEDSRGDLLTLEQIQQDLIKKVVPMVVHILKETVAS